MPAAARNRACEPHLLLFASASLSPFLSLSLSLSLSSSPIPFFNSLHSPDLLSLSFFLAASSHVNTKRQNLFDCIGICFYFLPSLGKERVFTCVPHDCEREEGKGEEIRPSNNYTHTHASHKVTRHQEKMYSSLWREQIDQKKEAKREEGKEKRIKQRERCKR